MFDEKVGVFGGGGVARNGLFFDRRQASFNRCAATIEIPWATANHIIFGVHVFPEMLVLEPQ